MKTALITGGAKRIGAQITQTLHENNYNVIIHYRRSESEALALAKKLNNIRVDSASTLQAELSDINAVQVLCNSINKLDVLVNNASVFYPTPVSEANQDSWNQIIATNLMAPFFLSQSLAFNLIKRERLYYQHC